MKIVISEKQLERLTNKKNVIDEIESPPSEPETGTTDIPKKSGYPEVGKWETGIERGPANQIGVTTWSDVVGSTVTRGKANPLK